MVAAHGEMSSDDWSRIGYVLTDLIDAQGNLDLVLDLSGLTNLEQAAGPIVVDAARQAHCHGGRLRLADRACRERRSLGGDGRPDGTGP